MNQRTQLTVAAIAKGRGIASADFVLKTVFRAARGLANRAMQMATPALPKILAALTFGMPTATANVAKMVPIAALKCMAMDPGSVGDAFGECLAKEAK